jgi:hypothetical protein
MSRNGLVPKQYCKKAHKYYYFNALLSVGRVSSKAARLGIANPVTAHKLQFAGCISIIIMKLETTSPAADYECPFPGSGQFYHGIRQQTRFQAIWEHRFEGMLMVAALRSPI